MKRLTSSLIGFTNRIVTELMASVRKSMSITREVIDNVMEWHRQRMLVDPGYPAALSAIVKAIVAIAVPRAIIASAVIALVLELLGAHSHRRIIGHDDEWDEFDY